MKKLILSLLVITTLMLMVVSVSAVHTSDVVVTTDDWLEASTLTDFTVEVKNTDGSSSIRKIIIYPHEEYSSFTCGTAPTNWTLSVGSESCTYSTLESTEFIISGNSKDFTLQATTSSDVEDAWLVTTIDDGNDPYNNNPVPTGWMIQNAIDAADEDDTINVPAGEYEENPLVDVNGITLNAGTGTILKGYFTVAANDITFEGFELDGSSISGSVRGFEFYYNRKGIKIRTNVIHNFTSGIYINPVDASSNNIIIENNEIYNTVAGIGGDSYKGVLIRNNHFYDNDEGVGYSDSESSGFAGPEIHGNHFSDNSIAVKNYATSVTLNAENNYWGVITYDEIDALVEGDVDYDPWCYDSMCTLTEPHDWIIPLSIGMNLVSIPLIPESTDINNVLGGDISDDAEKIWSYQEGEWKFNEPVADGTRWKAYDYMIQKIVPGYGYILFMEEESVAYGNGKELDVETPPEVILTTGWNLIGHYGLNDIGIDKAFSSLELGPSFYWNSLLTVNDEGELESVDQLEATRGYWLSIKGIELEEPDETKFFRYLPSQEAY